MHNYSKVTFFCMSSLLVISSLYAKAQEEIHDEKIKGIVKSVSVILYNGSFHPGKNPEWKSFQYYNSKGEIISYIHFTGQGDVEYKDTYKYNSKGNMTEFRDEQSGQLSEKAIMSYDAAGHLSKRLSLGADSLENYYNIYKHNVQGQMLEEDIYKANGSLISKSTYKRDAKGNPVETMVYDSTASLTKIWRDKYDHADNVVSDIQFSPQNQLLSANTHTYSYYPDGKIKVDMYYEKGIVNYKQTFDTHGSMIEDIMYSGTKDNDIMSNTTNVYKYDNKGNWVEEIVYENGEISQTFVRTIGY